MKKIVALLFLCICSVFSVFGATVSVQIAEINNPQGKTSDLSYILEDALLEYFFTRGVILSTSPVICNSQDLEKDFDNTIQESCMGQVDYLILLEVFFDISQSLSPEQPRLTNVKEIKWSLYLPDTEEKIAYGSKNTPKTSKNHDAREDISSFGYQLSEEIEKSILR